MTLVYRSNLSGALLIIIGVVLVLFAALRSISVLITFLSGAQTAYETAFAVGSIIIAILFIALGLIAIKKGRVIFSESKRLRQFLKKSLSRE